MSALLSRTLGPVAPGVPETSRHRSADLVRAAAALFDRHVEPEREFHPARREVGIDGLPFRWDLEASGRYGRIARADRVEGEGPRCRIEITPGAVKIARSDPHKRERALARADAARLAKAADGGWVAALPFDGCPTACDAASGAPCRVCRASYRSKITSWSTKSRAAMRYRLASLDYAPLFVNFFGEDTTPAMVTLTYPGDWLAVAPSNKVVRRHVEQLRKRWDRAWSNSGYPLVGVWKREFQRRGAPHYHVLCVPPADPGFREWLSETWAEIVGAAWCGDVCWSKERAQGAAFACCERGRHVVAGTGVDYREGGRATDPQRLAVYFSKHGGYAAKEYQNQGPVQWRGRGGVGRFWGVWGLSPVVEAVGLSSEQTQAVARTIRRLERTRRWSVPIRVLRCTRPEGVNLTTGVVQDGGHVHTRGCFRNSTKVVQRFPGSAGYVLSNDAAALASALARVAYESQRGGYVGWWERAVEQDPASGGARWWSSTGRRRGFLP